MNQQEETLQARREQETLSPFYSLQVVSTRFLVLFGPVGSLLADSSQAPLLISDALAVHFGIPWAKPVPFCGWLLPRKRAGHPENSQHSTRFIPKCTDKTCQNR